MSKGYELDVLQGANRMLSENRIEMITFEFGGGNIDTRTFFQDFYYSLTEHGMQISRITAGGHARKLSSYQEIYEQFRTTNFLAQKIS